MITIINPSVEVITEKNPLKRIELCARVCYKSESKITEDSAYKFCKGMLNSGHTSVFEHAFVKVPGEVWRKENMSFARAMGSYGIQDRVKCRMSSPVHWMNARDFLALGGSLDALAELECDDTEFCTVRFITDRAIWLELRRHRAMQAMDDTLDIDATIPMGVTQESTRYVNYGDCTQFVRPLPFEWASDETSTKYKLWEDACAASAKYYRDMLAEGCRPQEARSVLNSSAKTELIISGDVFRWQSLIDLRYAEGAHPQCRLLLEMLGKEDNCNEYIKRHLEEVAKA